jgi:hypothetical protein
VFASLHTYADDKDESAFQKIHLPAICLSATDLQAMFYQTTQKRFSPFVLNKLIAKLGVSALREAIYALYEEQTGNSRAQLSASKKMELISNDLNFMKINGRIQKIVHLSNDDFIASFEDESNWVDVVSAIEEITPVPGVPEVPATEGSAATETEPAVPPTALIPGIPAIIGRDAVVGYHTVQTSVEINVYSDILQLGFTLVVHFSAYMNDDTEFKSIPALAVIAYDGPDGDSTQLPKCGLCVEYDRSYPALEPEPAV